jgi:hypothetical protein
MSEAIDQTTIELLARWRRQDQTDDPEEIRAAEKELAAFKRSMNEVRSEIGACVLFPEDC